MFTLGICRGIDYTILYFEGLLLVTVFPLWPHFFPCSPLFAGVTAREALSRSLLLSPYHLTVPHQAEHIDNYQVGHWLLF